MLGKERRGHVPSSYQPISAALRESCDCCPEGMSRKHRLIVSMETQEHGGLVLSSFVLHGTVEHKNINCEKS